MPLLDSASGETKAEIGKEDKEKIEYYPHFAFKESSTNFLLMLMNFRESKVYLSQIAFMVSNVILIN